MIRPWCLLGHPSLVLSPSLTSVPLPAAALMWLDKSSDNYDNDNRL